MYSYVKLDFGPIGFHYGWGCTAQSKQTQSGQQSVHGWFRPKTDNYNGRHHYIISCLFCPKKFKNEIF